MSNINNTPNNTPNKNTFEAFEGFDTDNFAQTDEELLAPHFAAIAARGGRPEVFAEDEAEAEAAEAAKMVTFMNALRSAKSFMAAEAVASAMIKAGLIRTVCLFRKEYTGPNLRLTQVHQYTGGEWETVWYTNGIPAFCGDYDPRFVLLDWAREDFIKDWRDEVYVETYEGSFLWTDGRVEFQTRQHPSYWI